MTPGKHWSKRGGQVVRTGTHRQSGRTTPPFRGVCPLSTTHDNIGGAGRCGPFRIAVGLFAFSAIPSSQYV